MRESKLYLNFFRRNLLIYLGLIVLFSALGWIYFERQSSIYRSSKLLQMEYNKQEVQQEISLTDQAVSVIRSENVQNQLGISENSSLDVFKPGPLSMNITVASNNKVEAENLLDRTVEYLTLNYKLNEIGQKINSVSYPDTNLGILEGLVVGFLGATLIGLIREYFRKF